MGSDSITAFAESVTVDALETDPYPIYARLRREAPVCYLPAVRLWFVTRYDDVEFVGTHAGPRPGAAAGVPWRLGVPRPAPPRRAPLAERGHTRVSSLRSASWVLAERRARSTKVEANPTASRARASHGAQIVGLVTL